MLAAVVALLCLAELHRVTAWSYRSNGADWGVEGMCGKGGTQSPINLPLSAPPEEEELTMFLKYPKLESSVTVYNTGKSIAFTLPDRYRSGFGLGRGSDDVPDKVKKFEAEEDTIAYRLWQVNFHSPSEHTVNGERLPLEMQMMHQQATGGDGLAVVVVLFNAAPNAYGAFLDSILGKSMPEKAGEEAVSSTPVELAPLLSGSSFYTYEGSLTVPPCEQQVRYFVRKEPVAAAQAQLKQFSDILQATGPKGNYRALQSLSGQVSLVGAVDLVSMTAVPPTVSKLHTEKAQASKLDTSACNSTYFDSVMANHGRVATTDRKEMVEAKTRYNTAKRELTAVQASIENNAREVKTLTNLYDNTPGPVEKINVKWKLVAAKKLQESAQAQLPNNVKELEGAKANLLKQIMIDCLAPTQAEEKAPVAFKKPKAKATRHWKYPEPHVQLPRGLAGSPFSQKQPNANEVVMSDKIAANLQQPEVPESEQVNEAKSNAARDRSVPHVEVTDKTLELRLPISPPADHAAFSGALIKALEKSGGLSEGRLELKEIREASVPSVHSSGTAILAQVQAKEFPLRNLRRTSAA